MKTQTRPVGKQRLRSLLLYGSFLLSSAAFAAVYQAEDYSYFSDSSPGNTGGEYRADDVDIERCSDTGGGFNVGWIAADEWLVFQDLTIPQSGTYTINARVASVNGASFSVDLDAGTVPLGTLSVPATGGWQSWQTVSTSTEISAGTYNLGVYALQGGWNFNWIEVVPVSTPTPTPTATPTPTPTPSPTPSPTLTPTPTPSPEGRIALFQAEDYSFFEDTTPGNEGAAYRNDDVDIEEATDIGGGYNVGWWEQSEWLSYSGLNVPSQNEYKIRARVASLNGGSISFDLNQGELALGQIDVPATGGWQNWQTLEVVVAMPAGVHRLGTYALTGGVNLNWIEIVGNSGNENLNLLWSDEFDAIDRSVWNFEETDNVNNHELQWYAGEQNASIEFDPIADSNVLVIEARKEQGGTCWHGGPCAYTSARLNTRFNRSFQYGRIEARIRLPKIAGIWPAFWMLGDDFNVNGWPRGGEIDIMEHVNDTDHVTAALHGPGYSGNTPLTSGVTLDRDIEENYFVYAIEWDTNGIRWFVDDNNFYSVARAEVEQFGDWVYDQPFWLILNVAVGGTLPGDPNPEVFPPQRMYVDYVRVYEPTTGPTPTPTPTPQPGCQSSASYQGNAAAIPGRVEAENYDVACDGFAGYLDNDVENQGGAYRSDAVDIEESSDQGGGHNVGWIDAGEWLNYTVNIAEAGNYDISVRAASDGNNSTFNLSLNGNTLGSAINLRNTGGWQAWRSVSGGTVILPAGEHTIRVSVEQGGFNLNYIEFTDASGRTDPGGVHIADRTRGEWTLITVPDTQHYSQNRPNAPIQHMRDAFDWIVAVKDQLNVQFVQGLGDIVEDWNQEWEWDNSTSAWYKLRGQVPFMPITGNHDDPFTMNRYFPVSMFSGEPWWGGSSGGIENNYALMTIGNEEYMFLQIETYDQFSRFNPTGLEFANQVLPQHPNRKVILATHDTWETTTVRENILTRFDNIIMSNAGHTCKREALYLTNGPSGGVSHNFITDYQCDQQEVMLLRYYLFKPMEDKVEYYTYSPITQQFEADASSQGSFTLIQEDP